MNKPQITLNPDGYTVRGPDKDKGFKVTFDIGEYQQTEVAKLLAIPQDTLLKLMVEVES